MARAQFRAPIRREIDRDYFTAQDLVTYYLAYYFGDSGTYSGSAAIYFKLALAAARSAASAAAADISILQLQKNFPT